MALKGPKPTDIPEKKLHFNTKNEITNLLNTSKNLQIHKNNNQKKDPYSLQFSEKEIQRDFKYKDFTSFCIFSFSFSSKRV